MKKSLIVIVLLIGSFFSVSFAENVDDAINRMYNNWLTIHNNKKDFQSDRWLRRDEAAKFFVKFAKLIGKTDYVKTVDQCEFSDINDSWSDLKNIVIESCRLWLFQGNKGKFNPKTQLTNAQAITVLVRLVIGNQSEVWLSHRADNYYSKAITFGVLLDDAMFSRDSIVIRGNVGSLIYNTNNANNKNQLVIQKWNMERYRKIYSNKYSLYKEDQLTYKICIVWDNDVCINLVQYNWLFMEYYNMMVPIWYPGSDLPKIDTWRQLTWEILKWRKERTCFGSYLENQFCVNENPNWALIMNIADQMWIGFNWWEYDPKEILKVIDF